jgi:ubiquinone biosynthesis protein
MQIIKRSAQVTQAVKNVQRLKTILAVFGHHGLEEFLIRMGLGRYLSSTAHASGVEKLTIPERLRMTFESLGPTFVKFGQVLGNRPDMLPEAFITEFKKLQDKVAPFSFELVKSPPAAKTLL